MTSNVQSTALPKVMKILGYAGLLPFLIPACSDGKCRLEWSRAAECGNF